MGHKHKRKCYIKKIEKYLPIVITSIGIGILLVIIVPIWVWFLCVSLALIVYGINKFG